MVGFMRWLLVPLRILSNRCAKHPSCSGSSDLEVAFVCAVPHRTMRWSRQGPPTSHLVLNRNYSGTVNGLSKFPYVRDTRRAVGLSGFRLLTHMMRANGSTSYGERFPDRVGVGGYNFGPFAARAALHASRLAVFGQLIRIAHGPHADGLMAMQLTCGFASLTQM